MKTVFYTIIGDSHYYGCRTDEFVKSFKYFHPDVDLVVFGQSDIDITFGKNSLLNFYNSKATFAKQLYNDYELVVNIDADHLIFGRMEEILLGDYDVAVPINKNSWLNCGIKALSSSNGVDDKAVDIVSYDRYYQGGLIASTSRLFWDYYEYACLRHGMLLRNKENDILNLLCHLLPFRVKVLEGGLEEFRCWYGCSSLGREHEFRVTNSGIVLDNKPVRAYHFARSGMTKIHPCELFGEEVVAFIYNRILVDYPLYYH